jgi:MFS family permease
VVAPTLARNRDFVKLWVGEAASMLGSRIAYVAYPLLVLAVTGSAAQAGVAGFLRTLPYFVLALPAGVLADRLDRRRLMIASDGVGAAAIGSLAVAIAFDRVTIAHLLIVAFLDGTAGLVFRTSEAGALPQVVRREQLPEAVARNAAREYGAYLVGPPLGGVLFGAGRVIPFVADACSYVTSALFVGSIARPLQDPRPRSSRSSIGSEAREGLLWMWGQPFLRTSAFLVAGANLATNALALTLILVAKDTGASSALVGAMLAFGAGGGLVGAIAAPRLQRHVSRRLIVAGYPWVGVFVVAAMALLPPPLALGALFGAWITFGPLWDAVVVGYRLAIVPDELQGRVESVGVLIAFGGAALGPLAAGFAFSFVGSRATLGLIGAWTLVLAVVGTVSSSLRIDDGGTQPV